MFQKVQISLQPKAFLKYV